MARGMVNALKKSEVLALLRESGPEYVSGEEVCRRLGVSRTAIWKQIRALREEGYAIEAAPRSGYRLTGVPDRLYSREILPGLGTEFMGRSFYYHESLDSTNREAAKLAGGGAPEGSLVVTEEQTGGRGRLGRGWFSPRGLGLWCSLVLRPGISPGEAPPVTMLAAVAVSAAVEKVAGVSPGIKWPNDILVRGKKFCGILTEMNAEMEKVNFLVVGMGVNVNTPREEFPPELADTATSLLQVKGEKVSRQELLKQLLREFEALYRTWLQSGFGPVLAEWKRRCVTLNCPVRISTPRESWEGWAEDVAEDGALILRFPDGSRRSFVSGEVSLRTRD